MGLKRRDSLYDLRQDGGAGVFSPCGMRLFSFASENPIHRVGIHVTSIKK